MGNPVRTSAQEEFNVIAESKDLRAWLESATQKDFSVTYKGKLESLKIEAERQIRKLRNDCEKAITGGVQREENEVVEQ